MQPKAHVFMGLSLLAAALAGCTGQFDVKQTEPLRVQINGGGQEASLDSTTGATQREFIIVKPATTQVVRVEVVARQTSAQAPTVIVIVKDRDTNAQLGERRVTVQNQTTANLDVDVRGKDNVVVVTQVINGSAVVNVAAMESTATTTTTGTEGENGDTNMTAPEDEGGDSSGPG